MIENIPNINLESIKIYSNFKDKEIAKNVIEKMINKNAIRNSYILINNNNINEFRKLLPDLFIEYQKKDNFEELLDILFNINK